MILRLCLSLLVLVHVQYSLAQKTVRLINKGKYENAEQLSYQQLQSLKVQYPGISTHTLLKPHELTKWLTPYHSIGLSRRMRGDFTMAELYLRKADSVYTLYKDAMTLVSQSRSWKPTIRYGSMKDLSIQKQANRYFLRQLERARVSMEYGDLENAKTILDDTNLAITKSYGSKASMSKTVYTGFGEYYMLTTQYDSSRYYFEKYIIALYSDPNYFDSSIKKLSDAFHGLAKSYVGSNDIETAIVASKKSYKYARHRFVKGTDGKNYLGKVAITNQLAESYRLQNKYNEALKWSNKAITLYNDKIHIVSPEKLPLLATRGQIFWALSDTLRANSCFKELTEVFFNYTQNNFPYLSEPEQASFYRQNKHLLDLAKGYYHYLYFELGYQEEYIARNLYEINLNNKGVLLNSSSKLVNLIYSKGDTSLTRQYIAIRELKEDKNRSVQIGDIKAVKQFDKQITQQEKILRNQLFIETEKYVYTESIKRAIPDSTNLIDVLKCKVYTLKNVITGQQSAMSLVDTEESKYLYFIFDDNLNLKVIRNDVSDRNLEGRFYKAHLNFTRNNIQNPEPYNAYFKFLEGYLSSNRLIVSGDGIYNLLNPEILFDGHAYLIDKYSFLSVVSAKDLLKEYPTKPELNDITLIGWPDYSTHKTRYEEIPKELPGTETEINGIKAALPESIGQYVYMRRAANEITVKNIPSTSILHFATHGFFEASTTKDPMHTSGLVLALSDSAQQHEDGMLSAYEASNLELTKTFLVVLSACETGQGEFEEGEGVWGLQRAFQVAGVRYIVMSLFKVDDEVTSTLMQQFYTNMIKGDQVLLAFRKAQLFVKQRYDKPIEWGAFVVKGF